MLQLLVRRILYGVIVLALMLVFVFAVMRLVPGDAVELQLADAGAVSEEQVAAMKDELGLSDPMPVQLAKWVGNAVQGDLGSSLWSDEPVTETILDRLPVTFELTVLAMLIAMAIGIPAGVFAAVRRNTWVDNVIRVGSVVGVSIPNFWLGLMLLTLLSLWFNWIPPLGYRGLFEDPWTNIQQVILPSLALGVAVSASLARLTRSAVLEVLQADFIRTVRAKGLSERGVVFRHALRNSLISVVTLIGLQLGALLGGTVILESIFSLPGMGSLIFEAVSRRDYPVIQAAVLVYGATFIAVNILVDLAYGWIDPRVRPG
ncbi:MAG TPA: nickel ABC transporter permease [Acidimicrobiales bacterium]|nr:nickel ABC transporter permease [Acidimicrobiales bacterium]